MKRLAAPRLKRSHPVDVSGGGELGPTEHSMLGDHPRHATISGPGVPTNAATTKSESEPVPYVGGNAQGTTRPRRMLKGSSRWQQLATSNLFLGLVLAILAWPTSTDSLAVTAGLDPSWRAT